MFVFLMTLLGAAVGSFLTVAVDRFERGETFATGRSYCESCKKELRWWELVPVLSFLLLRGKCIRCDAKLPYTMLLFEVITAAVFGVLAYVNPMGYASPLFYIHLIVVSSFLLLFFYDWQYQVFPGVYLLVSAILVAIEVIVTSVLSTDISAVTTAVLGGVVGMALLGLLALPSRGRWMGYGDVLLAGILGLWVGYPLVYVVLLVAFYSGALVGVGLLAFKKTGKDHRIAFGPFLILGVLVTDIWGNSLFRAIMQLWGG